MINHIPSFADGDSQTIRDMGPSRDSTLEGPKTEPDGDILTPWTVLSHDVRSSLLSMLATLKLLNRGYYGRMDKDVAQKINELLSHATRLSGVAEEWLERTFAVLEGPVAGTHRKE